MTTEENGRERKLTPKMGAFIEAWKQIPFRTQEQCAELVGVHPQRVSAWKQDYDFWPACEAARRQAIRDVAPELQERIALAADEALTAKLALLHGKDTPASVRDGVSTWLLERVIGRQPERVQLDSKTALVAKVESVLDAPIPFDWDSYRKIFTELLHEATDDELDALENAAPRTTSSSAILSPPG